MDFLINLILILYFTFWFWFPMLVLWVIIKMIKSA